MSDEIQKSRKRIKVVDDDDSCDVESDSGNSSSSSQVSDLAGTKRRKTEPVQSKLVTGQVKSNPNPFLCLSRDLQLVLGRNFSFDEISNKISEAVSDLCNSANYGHCREKNLMERILPALTWDNHCGHLLLNCAHQIVKNRNNRNAENKQHLFIEMKKMLVGGNGMCALNELIEVLDNEIEFEERDIHHLLRTKVDRDFIFCLISSPRLLNYLNEDSRFLIVKLMVEIKYENLKSEIKNPLIATATADEKKEEKKERKGEEEDDEDVGGEEEDEDDSEEASEWTEKCVVIQLQWLQAFADAGLFDQMKVETRLGTQDGIRMLLSLAYRYYHRSHIDLNESQFPSLFLEILKTVIRRNFQLIETDEDFRKLIGGMVAEHYFNLYEKEQLFGNPFYLFATNVLPTLSPVTPSSSTLDRKDFVERVVVNITNIDILTVVCGGIASIDRKLLDEYYNLLGKRHPRDPHR